MDSKSEIQKSKPQKEENKEEEGGRGRRLRGKEKMKKKKEEGTGRRKEKKKLQKEKRLISCLPHDIAVEILSRLPISSVIKFRVACRSWNLLSRNLHFAKMHMSRSSTSQRTCLIFHSHLTIPNELHFVEFSDFRDSSDYRDSSIVRKFNIPFSASMPKFRVIGSCKGLLCLVDSLLVRSIYIYNPFTSDYILLPEPMTFKRYIVIVGFGFHPVTKEYKLIKIAYEHKVISTFRDGEIRSNVQVYNLDSNEWRSIGEAPYLIHSCSPPGVLVSGKLHWLSQSVGRRNGRGFKDSIVSFDLANDSFEMLKLDTITPPSQEYYWSYLVALGDCLSLVVSPLSQPIVCVDVWVMKEYGEQESWVKMYTVNKDRNVHGIGLGNVICLLKNGNILLEWDQGWRKNLASYDQDTQRINIFRFRGMPKMFNAILHDGNLFPIVQS